MAASSATGQRIQWYRCPVPREELSKLNKRNDLMGFLQTGGFLGTLVATGCAAYFSVGRLPWPIVVVRFIQSSSQPRASIRFSVELCPLAHVEASSPA